MKKRNTHQDYEEQNDYAPSKSNTAMIAVYVILGILVIGSSFTIGYLWGQNEMLRTRIITPAAALGPAPTPTAAQAPAPTPNVPTAPAAKVNVALGANVMGDANAPITIVEFSDFQCPFCTRFYQQTESQLIDTYVKTGKAKFAYRHFPLSFHQNAQKAAEASECAAKQGKFWEMHDLIFKNSQGDGTGIAVADLKKYAADLKLDTTKFNSCLDNGETASIVQKDQSDGSAAGVSGTPSFYINGQQLVGAQPFSSFQQAIDSLQK